MNKKRKGMATAMMAVVILFIMAIAIVSKLKMASNLYITRELQSSMDSICEVALKSSIDEIYLKAEEMGEAAAVDNDYVFTKYYDLLDDALFDEKYIGQAYIKDIDLEERVDSWGFDDGENRVQYILSVEIEFEMLNAGDLKTVDKKTIRSVSRVVHK